MTDFMKEFLKKESSVGIILMIATVLAMIFARFDWVDISISTNHSCSVSVLWSCQFLPLPMLVSR